MGIFARIVLGFAVLGVASLAVLLLYKVASVDPDAAEGVGPAEGALPAIQLRKVGSHPLQEMLDLQMIEDIDMKMKKSDLGQPPVDAGSNPFATGIPFTHVPLPTKEKGQRRLLADSNVLSQPGIISFDKQPHATAEYYAYKYILTNLKEYSTQFVIYPYNFTYMPNETDRSTDIEYKRGGVFTLKPELLPKDKSAYNYFVSLNASTDVKFGKAKALYDVNIAVLKIEDYYDDVYKELTYESTQYCDFLASYLGKYRDCLSGSDYFAFKNDSQNAGKTAFVYLKEDDISTKGLLLTSDGAPRFQILIVPDFYAGAQDVITKKLGAKGLEQIKKYVSLGGLIYASGKGGYLLETWGILPTGLYDTKQFLTSTDSLLDVSLDGCAENKADFFQQLLCMNLTIGGPYAHSYLLSAFMMNPNKIENMTLIMSYNNQSATLKKKDTLGLTTELTAQEKTLLPFALLAPVDKGRVYLVNGNALFKRQYNGVFYNFLLMAMSKNVVFDAYVGTKDNKPIPGGEAGIQLDVKMSFINLFDTPVTNLGLHVWFPNNLLATNMPSSCVPDTTNLSAMVNISALNESSHLRCYQAQIGAFERYDVLINVEILDHTVTQQKYDILMIAPVVEYTATDTGITHRYDAGSIRTNAALAALLRGTFNPDPIGFFPLAGKGKYVDDVLQVENKEDTNALNVSFIGVIPIVSPIVDANDESKVIFLIRFLASYYKTNERTYYYPFVKEEGKNYDYVDYAWLTGKDIVMVAEWDIPVKAGKVLRSTAFPAAEGTGSFDIGNMNYSTNVGSKHTVLKQIYYIDADKFFEHAQARSMVFVDPSKRVGAQTLYPQGIPEGEKNPNKPTVVKKETVWCRNDIFLYPAKEYQRPANMNETFVISIDRYPRSGTCVNGFGNARSQTVVAGHFGVQYEDGLMPNEYSNAMLMYCDKKQVTLSEIEAVSNGSIRPVHYLVPVKEPDIQRADDILNFVANTDGSGYLQNYPEVRFVYGHTVRTLINGSISRQGGRLEIQLPNTVSFINEGTKDPAANYLISYSADQVAFYKTEYDATRKLVTAYFKRGLMPNEAYGKPSNIGIMFEELNVKEEIPITLTIYEMKYDISAPQLQYERFIFREVRNLILKPDRFFNLPAIEVRIDVNRGAANNTIIYPYELLEPYTRLGIYMQELEKHRTIWVSAESHHVTDPGLQTSAGAYSLLSAVGISSIPFVEYVTTGIGQLIPSCTSTTRIEWTDIWDRRWSQPLRSVFPSIVPLPGPVRNFMMTTTFELTKTGTTERVLEWNSDETLDIRVQIKLLNNYQKYFAITTCKDNQIPFLPTPASLYSIGRVFDPAPYSHQIGASDAPNSSYYVQFGHRSVYGMCFDEEGTVLKSINVSATDRTRIATAYLCAEELNPTRMLECAEQLADLPTVTKRAADNTAPLWMYSPEVDKYYPKNYIKANMWDMTCVDYDDSPMVKAHEYHMDNNLPGFDSGPAANVARIKPHNIIAQPIFKGFGYIITYENTKTLKRFPQYRGWWSDNLQNRDRTLLAGQSQSNDISVDKPTLLPDSAWINARDFINPGGKAIAANKLTNIHACLYNQHRVRVTPNQQYFSYSGNVYQNNIIPIIPDLEIDDPRLTNYDCTGVYQYSPYNISQVDNVLRTPTIRDWLYFSANLRGHALETINIPYTLKPHPNTKYEGLAKVQDGGRFVYWNPCCGPNAFLIVDNPVNVVEAKRTDMTITAEIFPKTTTTFNSVLYHLLTIEDPAEKLREWRHDTYTNNYGFGDSTVAVYVGGTQDTRAILNAGQYTLVKITFYNNAGFDWNMYGSAIDFQYVGTQPINADDLMYNKKHTIQAPLRYNFMIASIPEDLKPYITMVPSDHNIDVAPQFFDFMNINVVTIRDGFKGDYYYKITLADTLPESIRGRIHEISLAVNESCFDHLPGYNDPTLNYHDYKLKIPSIKFGIPYASGDYAGKVFYTLAYATGLKSVMNIPSYWNVEEAKLLTEAEIGSLRIASGDSENYKQKLLDVWTGLSNPGTIPISTALSGSDKVITLNLSQSFPTFPLKNGNNPDIASFNVLLKCNASQLAYGAVRVLSSPRVLYNDFTGKAKSNIVAAPLDKTVVSKGAWIVVSYSSQLMELNENGDYVVAKDQRLFAKDKDGIVKVILSTRNAGTDTAYNVNFTLVISDGITILTNLLAPQLNYTLRQSPDGPVFKLDTRRSFAAGDAHAEIIFLKFHSLTTRRLLASASAVTFIKKVSAEIDLLPVQGTVQVSQTINTPLTFSASTSDRDTVGLQATTEFVNGKPLFHVTATATPPTTTTGKNVRFLFKRQIIALDCDSDTVSTSTGNCANIARNTLVTIQALSETRTVDDQPIPASFTGFIRSGYYEYQVETYSETKLKLASATWRVVAERPVQPSGSSSEPSNNNDNKNGTSPQNPKPSEEPPVQPNSTSENQTNETVTVAASLFNGDYLLPIWAIVLIPVAAFLVVFIAAILIYRRYRNVKVYNDTSSQEVAIQAATEPAP